MTVPEKRASPAPAHFPPVAGCESFAFPRDPASRLPHPTASVTGLYARLLVRFHLLRRDSKDDLIPVGDTVTNLDAFLALGPCIRRLPAEVQA